MICLKLTLILETLTSSESADGFGDNHSIVATTSTVFEHATHPATTHVTIHPTILKRDMQEFDGISDDDFKDIEIE